MPGKRTKFKKEVITGFRWLVLFLAVFLGYWWVMTNYVIQDFWDPPFVMKSDLLQARLKQYPGHPLWLIMGSSRVDEGLRPGVLAGGMRNPDAPLIFNFGMGGVDMYRQLVSLRRLLAGGLKPARVGIEIVGAVIDRRDEAFADDPRLIPRARRDEVAGLCNYAAAPDVTRAYWRQSRLNPFFEYGMQIPNQTLSKRLLPLPFARHLESHSYDNWGWFAGPAAPIPPDDYAKGLEVAWKDYEIDFKDNPNYTVAPRSSRLVREAIDLCRNSGIDVFLLRMPEGRDFQAFYPAQANAVIEDWLQKLQLDNRVRLIDARSWYPDREYYLDGHHLNATGAEIFTRRLAQELSNP